MLVDLALHLERGDVLAPAPYVVLDPVDEVVVAVRVPPESVTGVQPEVAEEAQAGLGFAVVFGGHDPWLGAAHHELADMADRHLAVLVVDDPEIEARHRATRDVDGGHVVVADDRNVHLGGSVAGADADTETSTEIVE